MRELFEDENREGYERELRERMARNGCPVARAALARELELDQVKDPDSDVDEDELEDEEDELFSLAAMPEKSLYAIARRLGGEPPPRGKGE